MRVSDHTQTKPAPFSDFFLSGCFITGPALYKMFPQGINRLLRRP